MEYYNLIAGILLLVSFIGLIVYCAKGGNLLLGFLIMAIIWCLIGGVPMHTIVQDVFEKSVESYGPTIAIIVFGSWFGRVLVDTGIAGTIIRKTVELAGDKPLVTTILLTLVCAVVFTSAFGVGSVMAIGMIVLPILFSLGLEKRVAVATYIMAVASGMYLNIAYVNQLFALFPKMKYDNNYIRFAIIATLVHVAIILIFIFFHFFKAKSTTKAWAVSSPAQSQENRSLPGIVAIVPLIPIIMVAIFKWSPVPAFLVGIFIGLLLTKNLISYKVAVEKIQKTLYDGVADVGLLIGMLYGVNIFSAAARQVAPILKNVLGGVVPSTPITIVIVFCIIAPLALFRGPLMVFGSGAATLAILQSMGMFSQAFLFGLFLIPPVAMVANTCPTQSWGMWALSYAKLEPKQYIKTGVVWSWAILIINELLVFFMIGR